MVQYFMDGETVTEVVDVNSKKIAIAGKYSGKFNPSNYTSDEVNDYLYRKKKFFLPGESIEVS